MPTMARKVDPPPLLMERYELGELLGKGSFAKVYRARNVDSGEEVAIKIMDKDHLAKSGAEQHQIMSEIETMRRVRHPNVVRLHEVMANKRRIFVVMELVKGGSLFDYLAPGRGVGEHAARRVFHQLVSALEYCHSRGVYHRDIKLENILVDADRGDVKVADFGLSALADSKRKEEALFHTVCGTPMYIAPEVFTRRGYDGAVADLWACGIVLFVLVAGRLPFSNNLNTGMLYHKICRSEYQCPPSFSRSLVYLIRRLLCPDPARRITIPEIKHTKWFGRGFKEINFYIGNDQRPRSLGDYAHRDLDSDSDDDSVSSEDPSSTVAGARQRRNGGRRIHTSASAPALTSLEKNALVHHDEPRLRRPKSLNAFDIIASSPSFDLSGLFDDEPGEQMRFVSAAPVPTIISKLEEIAGHVSFTARTKEHQVSIEATRNGKRGALIISAKIFELSPELIMVKVCKKAGDTAEYRQFCDNELKPGLRGLVDGLPAEDGVRSRDSQ